MQAPPNIADFILFSGIAKSQSPGGEGLPNGKHVTPRAHTHAHTHKTYINSDVDKGKVGSNLRKS